FAIRVSVVDVDRARADRGQRDDATGDDGQRATTQRAIRLVDVFRGVALHAALHDMSSSSRSATHSGTSVEHQRRASSMRIDWTGGSNGNPPAMAYAE